MNSSFCKSDEYSSTLSINSFFPYPSLLLNGSISSPSETSSMKRYILYERMLKILSPSPWQEVREKRTNKNGIYNFFIYPIMR